MSLFDNEDLKIEKPYQNALRILDYSPQTEKQLFLKLLKKGYTKQIINKVINKLKEENLLNDKYYAKIYANNLVQNKHIGLKKILLKLNLKGIDKDDAVFIAEEVIKNNGGEEEIIKRFLKKNKISIKRLLGKNQEEKIKQKLYNNGFSFQVISRVTDNINKILKDLN
jgi:regulatory protein